MILPSANKYSDAIERKDPVHFSILNDYTFLFNEQSFKPEYSFKSGKNAVIFKASKNSKNYAIRCFLRGDDETFRRYEQASRFLAQKDLPWKTEFEFIEKEILIDGQQYPVLIMDWIDGMELNQYINTIVSDPFSLSRLQVNLIELSRNLEENSIGHGDLNYNHILIVKKSNDFNLKLVDYDSLYIPDFRNKRSMTVGSPGFQHPGRLATDFSQNIDRFSIWLIITALEAFKLDPSLWTNPGQLGYNKTINLLFTFRDLIAPEKSILFQKLSAYKQEGLNYYLNKLAGFCKTELNKIERPEIYINPGILTIQEKKYANPSPPADKEKLHDIEIKTMPAGKDVLVRGIKKGITPLRLSISKKDFNYVEVLNASEKTTLPINEQVRVYELDLLKKQPETKPLAPLTEPDEIVEFKADKYMVKEGEPTAIYWKVKGNSKVHISHIGEVNGKTGQEKIVVNNTTNYTLTLGSKKQSITIQVQPKAKPVEIPKIKEEMKVVKPVFPKLKRSKKLNLWIVLILVLATTVYFSMKFISRGKESKLVQESSENISVQKPAFSSANVTQFLNKLYGSYNNRNLSSIMNNYAGSVNEYYDSRLLTRDSLSSIINNLFIAPEFYECQPDFKTLTIQPQGERCKLVITINETLKNEQDTKNENFATTIEYVIDSSFKIISEKSAG